jgi:hypothetical protein
LKTLKNEIAIIYFSRNAESESNSKKVISKDSNKNLLLYKSLIEHSQKAIHKSGLEIFHFHEGNQIGDNFGEKLSNAFESVYNLGYQYVISVGNDCPNVSNVDWQNISTTLKEGKNILGPSNRGGAYLIGMPIENFNKREFENLAWQTNELFNGLIGLLGQKSYFLKVERDVNTVNDLALLKRIISKRHTFHKILRLIFFTFRLEFIILSDFLNRRIESFHFGLRAPPIK